MFRRTFSTTARRLADAAAESTSTASLGRKRRGVTRAEKWLHGPGKMFEHVQPGMAQYVSYRADQPFPMNPLFRPAPPLADSVREDIYRTYLSGKVSVAQLAQRTVPNSNLSSMLRPTSFAARTSLRTIAARSAVSLSGIGVAPPPSMMRRPYSVPSVDYDNKYADKLLKKAQAEGFKSVDEMKAAYKKRADDEVARKRAEEDAAQKVKDEKLAKTIATDTLPSHVKKLGDLVHLDKLQTESPEVIEKLWVGFHSNKDAVSAVIPRDMYLQLHGRAKQYPQTKRKPKSEKARIEEAEARKKATKEVVSPRGTKLVINLAATVPQGHVKRVYKSTVFRA
ncbi:hypothetical protein AMAG_13665 [Allomyces macrogynus ATCC 38327]|uniref:Uncharacterized protein n=1 Tax=Allomyces macrogynus (strain ATCC 38327) TaxID=578462 RepID=A0A0L0T3Z5_ALLM3|nr:hypothetical protein AMAG_13665 [Allomyces macrogynus ATCC 38327]|eukprot:KNE69284.1 hypothetical protein AMAG_13665 [Allomyces macrogynus ATCC 38327]